jgi:GNAT superfamily N-acetyltransferase
VPEVRVAASYDAEGIARVHVSSWQAAYRDILPAEYLAELRWEKRYEFWQRELVAPSTVGMSTWVLAEGTRVLGFVSTGPARDDDRRRAEAWELYAIYLAEDRWGQGLGRALADVAIDAVPDQVADVSLWVLSGNDLARRFYERLGFCLDGHEQTAAIGEREVLEVRYVAERKPGRS